MATVSGLLKILFNSRRTGVRRSRSLRTESQQVESLENRLAMAVDVAFQTPTGGAGEDWVTVLASFGSDAYVKRVATASQDLFVADNGSFFDRDVIEGVDSAINNVYVFNGQRVDRTTTFTSNDTRFGVPIGYPEGAVTEMQFRLPDESIDANGSINGRLRKGNLEEDITFELNNGVLVSSVPGMEVSFSSNGAGDGAVVTLRASLLGIDIGTTDMPTLSMDYNTRLDGELATTRVFRSTGLSRAISAQGGNGSPGVTRFQLFDPADHQMVPGTLSGAIDINFPDVRELLANNPLVFQAQEIGQNDVIIPLSFGNDFFNGPPGNANFGIRSNDVTINFNHRDSNGATQNSDLLISGDLNTLTGVVTLRTTLEYDTNRTNNPIALATTLENVTMGLRDVNSTNDLVDPQGTQFDDAGNGFTLFPDQTFTQGLFVELPNAGSSISIESPLVTAGQLGSGLADNVVLAASDIRINTPLRATSQFTVPSQVETFFNTVSESVVVNAPVASPVFDIRLADSSDTGAIGRSKLLIGSAGSLSNLADVLSPVTDDLPQAISAYIEVHDGDILIEGQLSAKNQSYALTSGIGSEEEGPYRFTTESQSTGVDTGIIVGDTVGVTLGNDTFGLDFESFQTMVSDVSLSTTVNQLRIQAASREGHSSDFPFPYNLRIREEGDLIIDGVSASSGNIDMAASGKLDFLAAVNSFGNINFSSGDAFTVSAPITTAFGTITITGPEVNVNNSVRVLDGLANYQQTDVSLTATNGPLVMNDAVLAINGVKLTAGGENGEVRGDARIFSDRLMVDAGASVDLRTSANIVQVRALGDVRLEEETSAAFEVRDSSFVTIVANGQDLLLDDDDDAATGDNQGREALSPVLYADIIDADKIVVSAPNGSIDVLHKGSRPVEIGDGDAIRASATDPLVTSPELVTAGGSVVIRSDYSGNILVSDAPAATSGAIEVRFSTTKALPEFPNTEFERSANPGKNEATGLITRLNLSADNGIIELGDVNANDIRLGDRLLVKDGFSGFASDTGEPDGNVINGIYVIREKEFINADTIQLKMNRFTDFDTTSELDGRRYVRVRDGSETLATTTRGKVFVSDGFDNKSPEDSSATPIRVDAIPSRTGYVTASATTTAALPGIYDQTSGTITAEENGAITSDQNRVLFDGVALFEGDKVLVKEPLDIEKGSQLSLSVGLYVVDDVGVANQSAWVLKRYEGFDEDGSGTSNEFYTGVVAITQGQLRTSDTGEMFKIGYESINFAPLVFNEVSDFRDTDNGAGGTYLTEAFDPSLQYRTDIGTANPLGFVTFEVTSEAGVNNATGSLGRTLDLVQANSAYVELPGGLREGQDFQTSIGAGVTRIELEQELPLIDMPVTLDAPNGLIIDGSRIEVDRIGSIVRTGGIFSRIGPVHPSTVSTARRLVRNAGEDSSLDEVNGLEIAPEGAGTIIRNVAIGGFANGAAINIVGAKNVLVDQVLVGIDADGNTMPNEYGIRVQNAVNGGKGEFSTIQNTTIVASSKAGIRLGDNTDGVRIIGNTIGLNTFPNTVGVEVDSNQNGTVLIGAKRILPSVSVLSQSTIPLDASSVSVAKSATTDVFEVGVQLLDRSGNREWVVESITVDPADETKYILDVTGPAFDSDALNVVLVVEVGYFADVASRAETITLPAGVDRDRLHVGQLILGTVPGTIANGTYITTIEAGSDDQTVIGLSQPALNTVRTGILFNAPARNQVSFNATGIVLKSGSSRILATDVTRSIFDGIRIEDVAADGKHEIGGADGTELRADNVAVNANATAGIRFTEKFFAGLGTLELKQEQVDKIAIRGNYLGTNLVFATEGLSNGLDGATNMLFEDTEVQEDYLTKDGRGVDGRYEAKYRPEDNPNQESDLVEFESFDSEGNLHLTGNPVSPPSGGIGGFPGFGGGDGDDDRPLPPPPTMR